MFAEIRSKTVGFHLDKWHEQQLGRPAEGGEVCPPCADALGGIGCGARGQEDDADGRLGDRWARRWFFFGREVAHAEVL